MLRWKLVGLYAAILTVVLGGLSVALLLGLRRSLERGVDTELEARARAVVALAEYEGGRWFVEGKSGLDAEFSEASGLYYLVIDARGRVVLSSALARRLEVVPPGRDGLREFARGGRLYRERTVSLDKMPDEGVATERVRVVCGKDTEPTDLAVMKLTGQLLVLGPVALVLALAGGFFLVSRALAPIDRIARTAAEIEAQDLSRRIDVRGRDELARLSETLNGMFARLQGAFERQTRFTADASHELRTPLAVVAGNVDLALQRERAPEEYREFLRDIGEAAERMRSIVEGLLTLARADAKAIALRRESVSLTAVAEDIVRLHRPLADRQQVTVAVESAPEARATGDPERLKELVSNLVTNAIRYNRPGGRVTVRVAPGTLAVEDTGIGISAEDLPHIFDRFYRVDKARSRDVGGSGLGLAIAKWIADAHGGTIGVTSEPGVGSRFVVTLP